MNLEEMTAYYDERWREQSRTNPAAQTFPFWRDHFTVRCAMLLRGVRTVLDVGGGWGVVAHLARHLPSQWTVLEVSREAIAHGKRLGCQVEFRHGTPEWCDLGLHRLGGAFLGQILEHVEAVDPFMLAVRRLLVPFAPVVVVVPSGQNHDDPDHKRHFSHEAFFAKLTEHLDNVHVKRSEDRTQFCGIGQSIPVLP